MLSPSKLITNLDTGEQTPIKVQPKAELGIKGGGANPALGSANPTAATAWRGWSHRNNTNVNAGTAHHHSERDEQRAFIGPGSAQK